MFIPLVRLRTDQDNEYLETSLKTKQCPKCIKSGVGPKAVSGFCKAKGRADGLQAYCRECHNKNLRGTKYSSTKRRWKLKNPRAVGESHLKRRYSMTAAQYEELFLAQVGECAICKGAIVSILSGKSTKSTAAHVDHCHSSGKIRGLLCSHCNTGLGRFRDDERIMLKAVRYLRASRNRMDNKSWESRNDSRVESAAVRDHDLAHVVEVNTG